MMRFDRRGERFRVVDLVELHSAFALHNLHTKVKIDRKRIKKLLRYFSEVRLPFHRYL